MRKTAVGLGLGWIFLLGCGVVFGEETAVLKYRMETGAQYKYRLTVKTETLQQIHGQKIGRAEEWQIGYGITVLSGAGNKNGVLMRVVYDSIHYELASPFHQCSYQLVPGKEYTPSTLQPYANLVETDFNVRLQNRIKIDRILGNGNSQPLELQQLVSRVRPEELTPDLIFPYLCQNIFPEVPKGNKALATGAVWQGKTVLTDGRITPEVVFQYRIGKVDSNKVRVEFQSPSGCSMKQKWACKFNQKVLAEVASDLSGAAKGSYQLDKTTGVPLEGETSFDMTGKVCRDEKTFPAVWRTEIRYTLVSQN